MPTVRSIARHVNMSPATVSRALRGGDGVSADTLAKVQDAVVELGYGKGRQPKFKRSIALIVTTQPDGEPFELSRRHLLVIGQEFAKRGWQSHPVMVPGVGNEGSKVLADFLENRGVDGARVDGCLMIGRLAPGLVSRFHQLLSKGFHGNVVMLCSHDVSNGISGVAMMDYEGGCDAAQILIKEGHRRIGWIGSLGSEEVAARRLGGVRATIRRAGAVLCQELWLNERDPLPHTEVARRMAEVLPADRAEWPTAWVCSNDWLGAKLIVWARREGLEVPRDLSVVAFDNTHVAEHLAEAIITTVVFDNESIARKAVEVMEKRFESADGDVVVLSLPHRIRQGETVGPPRSGAREHAAEGYARTEAPSA